MVLGLCLVASIWFHRKKIVYSVISRQLASLDVYDLHYSIGELNSGCFELRDISWGDQEQPFLYLSFLKISFTPKSLYAGFVNKVSLGRFETTLSLDQENKIRSELLERGKLVAERAKRKYSSQESDVEKSEIILPELHLERGTVILAAPDGSEVGRLRCNGNLSNGRGGLILKGDVKLHSGKSLAFDGRIDLQTLDLNSFSAGIKSNIDFGSFIDPSLGFESNVVDLNGTLLVNDLGSFPEWKLDLQVPETCYKADNINFALSSKLEGKCEFGGSLTNINGSGEFFLGELDCDIKKQAGRPVCSNWVERIYFDFELPAIPLDALKYAVVSGRAGVCNLSCQADGLIDLNKGCLDIPFDASMESGLDLSDASFGWLSFDAGGLAINAGDIDLLVGNSIVNLSASVSVTDEPLIVHVNAAVPLVDPASGTLEFDVSEFLLDSDGPIGELIADKSGQFFDFNGKFAASGKLESFHPNAAFTGKLSLKDGVLVREKLQVSGVALQMPFRFNGKLGSTGSPFMKIDSVQIGNFYMSDGNVLFHLLEDELFVETAEIGWAKGFLRTHCIHAGFDGDIRNEFTVYADRVDLGEVFTLVMPFKGRMEGVLYGRFPVGLKKKRLKLSSGFLYSLPGQGGVLKLEDPHDMEGLLERAGISRQLKKPLSHALSDVDFSAIRFDLENGGADDSVLRIKLDGESKYEEWPAPVDLNINLHGPLENIVNLGVDMQRIKNGR